MMSKRFGGDFDSESIKRAIAEQESITLASDFWSDTARAEQVLAKIKALKSTIEPWENLRAQVSDLLVMYELAEQEQSVELSNEVIETLSTLSANYQSSRVLSMLSGEVDFNNAFLSIHAGAGGTEACDWAKMLLRMYTRWCQTKDFTVETIDIVEAEGGIKSITLEVSGDYAYGLLKGENGVHRLVRISPFDSNARRHTSFTSVYVFPVLNDNIEVDIRPEDLRVDTFRASGAGGQHINKTDSAVRITHLPTGIVAASQSQRSQIMNRQTAMNMLKAKLYEYYRQKKEEENAKFQAEKKGISWGNQIRSYVFQPYTLVKDHRTSKEIGNIQAVMDGQIDDFINSYLEFCWQP